MCCMSSDEAATVVGGGGGGGGGGERLDFTSFLTFLPATFVDGQRQKLVLLGIIGAWLFLDI